MNDEIVKIYNEDGVYLNQMISKKEAKQKNLFHKAVHVWIMIENKILIQQRSEKYFQINGIFLLLAI